VFPKSCVFFLNDDDDDDDEEEEEEEEEVSYSTLPDINMYIFPPPPPPVDQHQVRCRGDQEASLPARTKGRRGG
jgi:hypothetical protein